MTVYGWVHLVRSKEHAEKLWLAIFNSEEISLFYYAVLEGMFLTRDGRFFGKEDGKSFLFLTNSTNTSIIDELVGISLTSYEETISLDELYDSDFVELDQHGLIIWGINYLTQEQFYKQLGK